MPLGGSEYASAVRHETLCLTDPVPSMGLQIAAFTHVPSEA